MALTANRELRFYTSPALIELPVDDNVVIWKGALVGRNRSTGYCRPLSSGDDFLGVAYQKADNTVAGHTAGGISVRLQQNVDVVHTLSGAANGDVGKTAYATDDATLTLNPSGTSRIGRIVALEGTDTVRVRCQPVMESSGVQENDAVVSLGDVSATLTLDHINKTILVANTAARTLTLPAAAAVRAGGRLRVVKTTAAAFAVTLDANAAELIDGSATFAGVDALYDCVELVCTGSEWVILNRDIA
ncbi:MAG: hypothetical protein AB7Q17_15205 [Phycisphaerae bacterium]